LGAQLPADATSLNARVEAVIPGKSHHAVKWNAGHASRSELFDAVVCALPAMTLAHVATDMTGARPLAMLDAIPHPPVSALFLGYRREQISHPLDGFGLLVPAREKRAMLGAIFSSSTFPGRAPNGHVALTVMIGGTLQPELAALSPAQLLAAVRGDLRELLGVTGEPVFLRHTFWPRAIPQYSLGYERYVEAMHAYESMHPGIFIGGQVRDGIALPSCIAAGETLAARALASPSPQPGLSSNR
jgi:protoporphyrinogen/coproporphyrinogen III oxidase